MQGFIRELLCSGDLLSSGMDHINSETEIMDTPEFEKVRNIDH